VNVDHPAIRTLSLCSGYGGLDIGFDAACEHLGLASRTVAYVEWEAFAASLLLARMEAQALAPAPVWCGDLGRLDGTCLRGRIDAVTAGFPCQPHSVAGSRKGTDDTRWIWPDIVRLVRESGAWLVVLENVAGLLSSGGFGPVLRDLAALGFAAEWGVLSAGSVGASHRRERVFIVAYRPQHGRIEGRAESAGQQGRPDAAERDESMAHANGAERRAMRACVRGGSQGADGGRQEDRGAGVAVETLGHAERSRRQASWRGRQEHAGRESQQGCGELADASRTHSEGGGQRRDATGWQEQARHAGLGGRGLFAPGPDDSRWPDIIAERPDLAPATEPGVRGVVDGYPVVVDESRANQLRAIGNGVVPLQAATAIVCLMRRLGLGE
jgi:DNA (cytosine-5)-methyltransferase 1